MWLLDRLVGGPPVKLVEWVEQSPSETLVWRLPPARICAGAKLFVNPGQAAVFASGNQIGDWFGPGRFTLEATTLPILASWKRVSESDSAFRADVYFVSTRHWTAQPWSAANALVVKDAAHGTIRAKASGSFGFAITDPAAFIRGMIPIDQGGYTLTSLRNMVAHFLSESVRTEAIQSTDLLGSRGRLGLLAGEQVARELAKIGVTLSRFVVENVTPRPDVRKAVVPSDHEPEGYTNNLSGAHPALAAPGPSGVSALLDALNEPTIPAAGPISKRIPLADAPEGVFVTPTHYSSGPPSERLPLHDSPSLPAGGGSFLLSGPTTGVLAPAPVLPPPENTPAQSAPPAEPGAASVQAAQAAQTAPAEPAARAPAPSASVSPPPGEPTSAAGPAIGSEQSALSLPPPSSVLPLPPPLPAVLEFHVGLGGAVAGPFDLLTLAARAREGSFTARALVWRPGMEAWVRAETVPELAGLFQVAPPPLPPE